MSISFPTNTKAVIDSIREVIGRDITVISEIEGDTCPDCVFDTVTNKSYDPFCNTCSGVGYLTTVSSTVLKAHVLWNTVNSVYQSPGGTLFTGDCKATVEYTGDILELVKDAKYFIVDDRDMYLENYDLRGAPAINRIALALRQDPRDRR